MEKLICIKVECEWATSSVCGSTHCSPGVWLVSSVPRLGRLSYLFNKKRGKNCPSCSFQSLSSFWYLTEHLFIWDLSLFSYTQKYNAEYLFVLWCCVPSIWKWFSCLNRGIWYWVTDNVFVQVAEVTLDSQQAFLCWPLETTWNVIVGLCLHKFFFIMGVQIHLDSLWGFFVSLFFINWTRLWCSFM